MCKLSLVHWKLCLNVNFLEGWGSLLTHNAAREYKLVRPANVPAYTRTHSGWFDAELAFPIHQAVFNYSKEARVSICGTNPNYDGAQVHVLKNRFLHADKETLQSTARIKA